MKDRASCSIESLTRWLTTIVPRWTSSLQRSTSSRGSVRKTEYAIRHGASSNFKNDISSLRQVVLPQRDVVGRLARREFP